MHPVLNPDDNPVPASGRCPRLTQSARSTRVLDAAIRLFAQKGFQGTKTKEIAEAAGINEALIFRDFQTKEKLYCAILDYASNLIRTEQWIDELSVYADQRDDKMLFWHLAVKFFESFGREPVLFRVMLYSALEHHELARKFRDRQIEPLEKFIEEYIALRQHEGAFRPGEPHSLARCFLNMCHNRVLRQILFGSGGDSLTEAGAAEIFTQVFLNGVLSH
jgi:AcrR family transcriptional regulator